MKNLKFNLSAFSLIGLLSLPSGLFADESIQKLDQDKKPETKILAPLSLGVGVGSLLALSNPLRDENNAIMRLALEANLAVNENLNMTLESNWLLPGVGWGASLGFDYLLITGAFQPFVGTGIGVQRVGHSDKMSKEFGPSGYIRFGALIDIADEMQLRFAVPFRLIANQYDDRMVGVELSMLFSSPLRKTKVKVIRP